MLIEIKNLKKSYGSQKIFENFNLKIPRGKLTTIYGASGAGKSTLLNIIGMIEDYDEGEYYLFGDFAPIANSHSSLILRRHRISYLFQNFALLEDETIEKNLEIALIYKKCNASEKKEKMKKILQRVNLKHALKTKIFKLSGGEKQRVALARALLKDSDIILADEPTGSLDIENRNEILKLFKEEIQLGKTIIIVTHDPYIREISDIVIEV